MQQRKTGFDLLKVLAMLGIIMFHHFGSTIPSRFAALPGGFSASAYYYDAVNNLPNTVSKVTLLMDFCYGHFGSGLNMTFMLITGFFLFGRKIGYPKLLRKVAKVLYALVFFGVVLTISNFILLKCCYPFSSFPEYAPLFTLPNWLSGDNMWYLQAYGLFLLLILPLLKLFEDRLTRKQHLCLCFALVFIHLLAYSLYLPNLWLAPKLVQFITCYYIGGYVGKYQPKLRWRTLLAAAGLYVAAFFAYQYYWRYSCAVEQKPESYSYITVMAPFICCIIFATLCFLIFYRLRALNGLAGRAVKTLASATVGIYIFHANFVSVSYLLADQYWWHDWSRNGFFLFVLIDSLLLFAVGFLLDFLRQWTYRGIDRKLARLLPDPPAPPEES